MGKIEKFLRSDSWMHFTNAFLMMMFFILILQKFNIDIYLVIQLTIPPIVGYWWEVRGFKKRGIKKDYADVIWTTMGGYTAILLIMLPNFIN